MKGEGRDIWLIEEHDRTERGQTRLRVLPLRSYVELYEEESFSCRFLSEISVTICLINSYLVHSKQSH